MQNFIKRLSKEVMAKFKKPVTGGKDTESVVAGDDEAITEGDGYLIAPGSGEAKKKGKREKGGKKGLSSLVIVVLFFTVGVVVSYYLFIGGSNIVGSNGNKAKKKGYTLKINSYIRRDASIRAGQKKSSLLLARGSGNKDEARKPLASSVGDNNQNTASATPGEGHSVSPVQKAEQQVGAPSLVMPKAESKSGGGQKIIEASETDKGRGVQQGLSSLAKAGQNGHKEVQSADNRREGGYIDPFNYPEDEQYNMVVDNLQKQLTVVKLQAKIAEQRAIVIGTERKISLKTQSRDTITQVQETVKEENKPKKPGEEKLVFHLPTLSGVMISEYHKVAVLSDGKRVSVDSEVYPGLRVVEIEKNKVVCQNPSGRYYMITPNTSDIYMVSVPKEVATLYQTSAIAGAEKKPNNRAKQGSIRRMVLR